MPTALVAALLLLGACGPFAVDGPEEDVATPVDAPAVDMPVRSAASVEEEPVDVGDAGVDAAAPNVNDAGNADGGTDAAPTTKDTCLLIICVGH